VPRALVPHRPRHDRTGEEERCRIGPGHSLIFLLGDGFCPLNVLNTLKMVPEVWRRFSVMIA
jgi:adenosine/AMP kinase